jgi:hypothetical protein
MQNRWGWISGFSRYPRFINASMNRVLARSRGLMLSPLRIVPKIVLAI